MSDHGLDFPAPGEVFDLTSSQRGVPIQSDSDPDELFGPSREALCPDDPDADHAMQAQPDHMHAVVALLRPSLTSYGQDGFKTKTSGIFHSRHTLPDISRSTREFKRPTSPAMSSKRQPSIAGNGEGTEGSSPHISTHKTRQWRPPPSCSQGYTPPTSILPVTLFKVSVPVSIIKNRALPYKTITPFPFLKCPPEIRNTVYRFLLTMKNPIEFEGFLGRNGAMHRAQWSKCTSAKAKKRNKKLFLEILGVCRQIHDEASGIIYGFNVFKYRNSSIEGPKSVILPTRHIQLLKHVKVSIISRRSASAQHSKVADFIEQFIKEALMLETFELTWYGEGRTLLTQNGPVCQALQLLNVERHFVVVIAGEARMERAMQIELERKLRAQRVEIRRPVKAVTGEELSNEEVT